MWYTCVSLRSILLFYHPSRVYKSCLRNEVLYILAVHTLSCILKCKHVLYFLTTITRLIPPRMGWDQSMTFLPYGNKQRKHARLMHEGLNPIALQAQRQLQEYEAVVLLQEIATTPNAFYPLSRCWYCAFISSMHCPRLLKLHHFQSISVLETFFLPCVTTYVALFSQREFSHLSKGRFCRNLDELS